MNSNEAFSVILLAAATCLMLTAFGTIFGMMQALWGLPSNQVLILKAAFTIPRSNAILGLWVGAVLGILGLLKAAKRISPAVPIDSKPHLQGLLDEIRQVEGIHIALYTLFLIVPTGGTILALFFT